MSDALEYVQRKGWKYKLSGQEINLKRCPFCHDDNFHFYLNSVTSQYYCHKDDCEARGSLLTLKRHEGDIMPVKSFSELVPGEKEASELVSNALDAVNSAHQRLWTDRSVLIYLSGRRFSPEAIKYFKLGLEYYDGKDWLWYPAFSQGKVLNIKMRTLPPAERAFRRLKGGESILFNEDVLYEKTDSIILTEGEPDCISLWNEGIRNVVGVTVGAKGINSKWIDLLDKFPIIYFAYDMDEPGIAGAAEFAKRLGLERCRRIVLPVGVKDVNDFFIKGGTKEQFEIMMKGAQKFDVESVKSLATLLQESLVKFYNAEEDCGLEFPWDNVTRLTGKMQAGDLWMVAALPKTGKSTFGFNVIYHLARSGVPCLLIPLENPPPRLLPRIVALHLQKDSDTVNNYEDITRAYTEMKNIPFYFSAGYRKITWDVIADTIRSCIRRYGIRFVLFDNLHAMCRSKEHMVQEVSILSQNFKFLAEELGIPIMVIARPRKVGAGKMMEANDLMWSADLEADCDALILLHREEKPLNNGVVMTTEGVFEEECLVRINRTRWSGGGVTKLRFKDKMATITKM